MIRRARLASRTAASIALLAPSAAGAWSYDAYLSFAAPCPAAPTALRVEHESVAVDCGRTRADSAECAVVARYTVRNPTPEPVSVTLPAPAGGALSARGAALTDALVVAPGASVVVEMRDRQARPVERSRAWVFMRPLSTLEVLHPLLAERLEEVQRVSINYVRAGACRGGSDPAWAAVGSANVVTRVPRGWAPTPGWEQHGLCHPHDAGMTCMQVEEVPEALSVTMSVDRTLSGFVRPGGVAVALGATTGQGPRARLGYEFGLGRRVLVSASIEADAAGNVVLTPAVGVGFGLWRINSWRDLWKPAALIPWVGVPTGVAPDRRAGVRGQLTLAWLFGGLDVATDYWPLDGRVDVSVMLRAGL
jgi:hypothetical protein